MLIKKIIRKLLYEKKKMSVRKRIVNAHHDVLNYDKKEVADYRKKGFSFSESKIYDLKHNDYRNYITTWESYQPRMKETPYFCISDDKYLFSTVMGKYIEVPATYGLIFDGKIESIEADNLNNDNIYDFLVKQGGGVIKDRLGCDGFEVYVFNVEGGLLRYKEQLISREKLDEIIMRFSKGLIQSRIFQGTFEEKIFSGSVNTVRIISMRKKGSVEHEIVAALQRIGTSKSQPVDNFNQGGMSALIDIETGEIGRMTNVFAVDENGQRVFYEVHPDSGTRVKGLIVPNWASLKETIINITKKVPFFECVAWDVVVKDDGFALIETNMKSSMNVFQIHGGVRNGKIGEKYREHGYLFD